jgi:RNA polymerase sigma-70 factor (ECF subfamily)
MSQLDTRATLLFRVRDAQDQSAWAEFVELYMPLVYSYALKTGLQEADAADAAQETLLLVVRAIPSFHYEPERGSFRGWLLTILRNQLRRRAQRASQQSAGSGDTRILELLHEQPGREELDVWEREYRLRLFHWAAARVKDSFRESTWQAFWKTTVEGNAIAETALSLGVSEGAIYIARSRVLARIRKEIEQAESWSDHVSEHR